PDQRKAGEFSFWCDAKTKGMEGGDYSTAIFVTFDCSEQASLNIVEVVVVVAVVEVVIVLVVVAVVVVVVLRIRVVVSQLF
ncbi:hypothetical protein ElyMa_004786300, partial [Elysia marginata]